MVQPNTVAHHEQRSNIKLLSEQKLTPGAWKPGEPSHPGGLPGLLLAPSWLPDQLLLRFQGNGIMGYHSLQLSGPGSSLPLYLSITSMLHTEFPGLTLSGELPPPLYWSPGLVHQVPSHQHVLSPSHALCKFCPMYFPWGKHASCSVKTPGIPWLYTCSVQLAPPTQSLGLFLPQWQKASLYFTERKPRLTEALHLCQVPQLKHRPHISSKIGTGEWFNGEECLVPL